MTPQRLSRLIDAVYAAGEGTGAWRDALEHIADALGARQTTLLMVDWPSPTPVLVDAARSDPETLDAYERLALERALLESGGDTGEAARLLGIGRSTLYRKLAKHRLGGRAASARSGSRGVSAYPPIG